MVMEKLTQKTWPRMVLYVVVLGLLSFGFAYLIQYLISYFHISIEGMASTAYVVVFAVTLACNASIFAPIFVYLSLMIAAAKFLDPVLVALVASAAGALGEISGYYAGYLGKRIVRLENTPGYEKLVDWMRRHGPVAVFLLALQPIIPFDVAGLISGASRMPLWKFILPCWAGKFPKYLLGCYLGGAFLNILPPLPF